MSTRSSRPPQPESDDNEPNNTLQVLWGRDVKAAARLLTTSEARFLVDYYYQVQDYRIQSAGQVRSGEGAEPNAVLAYLTSETRLLEKRIQSALDAYTDATKIGQWLKATYGIGPVIAAGLLAHIDMQPWVCNLARGTRAACREDDPHPNDTCGRQRLRTVGHIWRFAGLDSSVTWQGAKNAAELVKAAFAAEPTAVRAMVWLARATSRQPSDLFASLGVLPVTREKAEEALCLSQPDQAGSIRACFDARPLHVDNAILHTCVTLAQPVEPIYALLYGDVKIDKTALAAVLAKRPWNAKLKTLCWKVGQSFMKFSGRDECYYGRKYRERKQYEIERNESGGNAETARATLAARNIGKETDAYAAYSQGKLPPSQIDGRARRWAVKLFLAHYFETHYRLLWNEEPMKPYPIQIMGHAHYIAPDHGVPEEEDD